MLSAWRKEDERVRDLAEMMVHQPQRVEADRLAFSITHVARDLQRLQVMAPRGLVVTHSNKWCQDRPESRPLERASRCDDTLKRPGADNPERLSSCPALV